MSLTAMKHVSRTVSNAPLRTTAQASRNRGALVQFRANKVVQGYSRAANSQRSHLRRFGILRPLSNQTPHPSTPASGDKPVLSGVHMPVICTSNIPAATLDYFLQCIEGNLEEESKWLHSNKDSTVADEVAFITSKDIRAITSGATRPATTFNSPFLGESIEQLRDWYVANIAAIEAFTNFVFIVLDSQTVKDSNTCLVVCTLEDELQTVRCDFKTCRSQIISIDYESEGFFDGFRDLFVKTGEVMTKEKFELAMKGRLYIENGQLKAEESELEE